MHHRIAKAAAIAAAAALTLAPASPLLAQNEEHRQTKTPIKHLVVIFQENVSFDHYFATYPSASNPVGEPAFHAAPATPSVDGLNDALLTNNPNAANPKRLDPLDPSQVVTCDQDHSYKDEQAAFDHGLMDRFVQSVAGGSCTD